LVSPDNLYVIAWFGRVFSVKTASAYLPGLEGNGTGFYPL